MAHTDKPRPRTPSRAQVLIGFNMTYLLVGYYYCIDPDGYTVNWLTAHCVLTLRLIGFAFDVNDGKLPEVPPPPTRPPSPVHQGGQVPIPLTGSSTDAGLRGR